MPSSLELSWKIVVTIPVGGPTYRTTNKLFNRRTGKTLLRKIGGISNCSFFPSTLEPTNVFYDALMKSKMENNFVGKKFPFQIERIDSSSFESVNVKIHLYGPNVVIVSIYLNPIDIVIGDVSLIALQDIETHDRLYGLVRSICGLIESGDNKHSAFDRKPKIYPCTLVRSIDIKERVSDEMAVETLTRHSDVKSTIVDDVLTKNEQHQLDDRSRILIDRQGIFAIAWHSAEETNKFERKYVSAQCMLELASAISRLLTQGQFHELTKYEQSSARELIHNPGIVFVDSVTALKTWELMLKEFKLTALYRKYAPPADEEVDQGKTDSSKWSDRKKWAMGIVSALTIAFITAVASNWQTILDGLGI